MLPVIVAVQEDAEFIGTLDSHGVLSTSAIHFLDHEWGTILATDFNTSSSSPANWTAFVQYVSLPDTLEMVQKSNVPVSPR